MRQELESVRVGHDRVRQVSGVVRQESFLKPPYFT